MSLSPSHIKTYYQSSDNNFIFKTDSILFDSYVHSIKTECLFFINANDVQTTREREKERVMWISFKYLHWMKIACGNFNRSSQIQPTFYHRHRVIGKESLTFPDTETWNIFRSGARFFVAIYNDKYKQSTLQIWKLYNKNCTWYVYRSGKFAFVDF